MKIKRLLAFSLSMAMMVSAMPALVFADETDSETTETSIVETSEPKETKEKKPAEPEETKVAETEKETEATETVAPKETEAPAETAKETEAPKETETPKETEKPAADTPVETPKTPESAETRMPKNGPAQHTKEVDVAVDSDGNLTWHRPDDDPSTEEDESDVYVNLFISGADYFIDEEDDNGVRIKDFKVNLKQAIDELILEKEIAKSEDGKYVIWVIQTWYESLYASKRIEFYYDSILTPGKMGTIKASINSDGLLKWNAYKSAIDYIVYINEYQVVCFEGRSVNLKKEIDWLVKSGYIVKPASNEYNIRIVAAGGKNCENIASWNDKYTYETEAEPIKTPAVMTGFQIEKGYLTWDAVEGATDYRVNLYVGSKLVDYCLVETNKADVNNQISSVIEDGGVPKDTTNFSFEVIALSYHYSSFGDDEPLVLANGRYDNYELKVEANPFSVKGKKATVKYQKLRKKKQIIAATRVITGLGTARGPKTFTKVSGNKKISINKRTGTVTIKKRGLRKGKTYKVKVKIKAAGNYGYEPSGVKIVTFKIKVKK